jgi:hypothetical protein
MPFLLAIAIWFATAGFQTPVARQQNGTVTGVLRTDSGVPIPGVRVAVEPVGNALDAGVLESIGLTDDEGLYLLENVSPGRYRLVAGRINSPLYHPGVPDSSRATTIVVVAGETTKVPAMVFSRTRVAGRIVDLKTGQGRSIKSLTLCCDFTATTSSSASTLPTIVVTSLHSISAIVDEDGAFAFPDVPPGKYFLQAHDPGIVPVAQSIDVGHQDMEGIELKVTGGVRVDGFVTDRLSQRVSSVNITLKPDASNTMLESSATPIISAAGTIRQSLALATLANSPLDNLQRTVTAVKPRAVPATADGGFSFSGVLPGRYTLEANAPGGNAFSKQIEVGIHEAVAITLDVPFTQVTGRIVGSDGSALPTLTGSVRFVSTDPDARISFGFPDDAGRFSVLLTPGEYRLFTDTLNVDSSIESISDGPNDLRTQRLIVDGDRQQQIRINIAR